MATDTTVNNLIINKLTKAQYEAIASPSDTELYLVPDEIDNVPTSGSDNPVTSGGVYTALSGVVKTTGDQTIAGIKTFSDEVKMTAGGTSDITTNVLCAFKTNRAQITNFATHNILTGGTNSTTPITFYKYGSVSSQAPASLTQLAKIDTDGNIYEGTTKLSDKYLTSHQDISGKQDLLVSGSNIKTINNESILGSGNITIQGGSGGDANVIEGITMNGSALTPDANKVVDLGTVITAHQDISGKADKSEMSVTTSSDQTTITLKSGTSATVINSHQSLSSKQDTLVSGTNIKTINNTSLLGSGNIAVLDEATFVYDIDASGLVDGEKTIQSSDPYNAIHAAYQAGKVVYVRWTNDDNYFPNLFLPLNNKDFAPYSFLLNIVSLGATYMFEVDVNSNMVIIHYGSFELYSKPSGGIPKTDLASAVQTSLGKADTAIQSVKVNGTALTPDANKAVDVTVPTESTVSGWGFTKNTGTYSKPTGGIPATDLASAVQTSLGKADTALQSFTETDPTVPSWAKASSKPSYTAAEVGAVPTTRTVNGKTLSSDITLSASDVDALSSSTVIPDAQIQSDWNQTNTSAKDYIKNKPSIVGQVQADWNQTTTTEPDYIKNKPTIPTVPTISTDISADASSDTKTASPKAVKTYADSVAGDTNIIETVKVDGVALTPDSNKAVDIATLVPEVNHGTSDTTFTLTPNVMHIWGEVASLTVSLPTDNNSVLDEFLIEFTSGSTPTSFNYPSTIKWTQPLVPEANKTYHVSIVNNLAGWLTDGMTPEETGDENVIEVVKVNNVALTPDANKAVNVSVPTKVSDLTNDSGFISSYTETDPVFTASAAHGISSSDISNWNSKTSNVGTITGITMNGASKGTSGVVNLGTVLTAHQDISGKADKSATVSSVDYNTTSKKITKTINGTTSDVVTAAKIVTDGGGITSHQDISGKADKATTLAGYGITDAKIASGTITLGSNTITPLTSFTESDPVFSASAASGITSSDITNWNNKTSNTGTITGVSVNGTSVATSGVANITSVPASILNGAIKNGVTATTQSAGDNSTKVATTAYVDTAIDNLPEPMVFKGSLGTGGTITSLPTAAAANTGFTYKVITAGTYASQAAKVGDTFISDGSKWNLIPSGDEPSGTVTSITISATSPIAIDNSAAITTSGTRTISHATSGVTAGTYKSVTVNATGHVTGGTNPTTLSGYGITDAKIANGVITLGSNSITPLTSFTESDPVFTASAASGITSSDISNWNSKTSNVGTITGINMNGASKGTSGVVDLGTVITAHQDISGKADKTATVSTVAYDTTNHKITKTINGTTTDVVSATTIVNDSGLALPSVTTSDNGSILMVVAGTWRVQDIGLQIYYTGTGEPASTLGNDGDIYLQESE